MLKKAFCEYSHLQGYITSKILFRKALQLQSNIIGAKIYYTTKLCHV